MIETAERMTSEEAYEKHGIHSVEYAKASLRESLPVGSTVYCVIRHVSRSGMTRDISLKALGVDGQGEPYLSHLDGIAATVLDMRQRNNGIRIGGCGMDMGFALVYELAQRLYGDRYALNHRWV